MAIQTTRTLPQLELQCQNLGITVVPEKKKLQKDDYVKALRHHYIESYGGLSNLPLALSLMLRLESPMLASQYKMVKPDQEEEMWNSNKYFMEVKEDGMRVLEFFLGEAEPFNCYSRNNSTKDFLPISYKENVCLDGVDFSKITDKFIIDSECICLNPNISTILGRKGVITETQLQAVVAIMSMNSEDSIRIQRVESCPLMFKTFDCIWWNGEWLLDKPLMERRQYLKKALAQLTQAGFKAQMPKSNISNKKQFYNMIIKEGGEGGIFKRIDSPYTASSSRSHRDWVKVKRSFSETLQLEGLGDTIDGFITGFEEGTKGKANEGLVGTIIVSVFLQDTFGNTKTHEIAYISSLNDELRKAITDFDSEGNPILKPEYYNKVVEIDGKAVSARARRLQHAVLVNFRPDRSPDTCVIEEAFLNSLIL